MSSLKDTTTVRQDDAAVQAEMPGMGVVVPLSAHVQLRATGRALLLADILALAVSFMLGGIMAWAANIYLLDDTFQALISLATIEQGMLFTVLGAAALLWLDQRGHYRERLPMWEALGHVVAIACVGLLVGGFIQFAVKNDFSRLWLGLSWVLFAAQIWGGRWLVRHWLMARGRWHVPVLLLGAGNTADAITRALGSDSTMGFRVVSQLDAARLEQINQPRDWRRLLAGCGAGYVMIALEGTAITHHTPALRLLAAARVPYAVVPPWLGLPLAGQPHGFFTHDAVLLYNVNRLTLLLPRLVKRTFDILVAGVALLACAVPLLVIAALIRRDGGPALFVQPRLGRHGRLFNCLKLRTMHVDAEAVLAKALQDDAALADEWTQYQKLHNDPRITRIGRWLRRTSIDELPQLINVLRGDMSLVGPRPMLPQQKALYVDDFSFYAAVRPGITGPWQVSGRSALTFDDRIQLDAWYARHWSLWMDIVILFKTIPALARAGQAA